MKKTVYHQESEDTETASNFGFAACLLGVFFPPMLVVGASFLAAGHHHKNKELENARRLEADNEAEADRLAERWRYNRRDDETVIQICLKGTDGERTTFVYEIE